MSERIPKIEITKEMKKNDTLLIPNMLDIHFHLLQNILIECGYHVELLTNNSPTVIEQGLRYVHNDMCYPALCTIGQMIDALQSGKYDLDHTILVLTQTGGGCRASNYIYLLKKALINAGLEKTPVLSFNLSDPFNPEGIQVSIFTLIKILAAMEYGDLLMMISNHLRPYEKNKGEVNAYVDKWVATISNYFKEGKGFGFKEIETINRQIIDDFKQIELLNVHRTKVGIVGEIFVKFSALANNDLVKFLESQDCEVNVPGIMGFLLYALDMPLEDNRLYGGDHFKQKIGETLIHFITHYERILAKSVEGYMEAPRSYKDLKKSVDGFIGTGCKMGEGWLLVSEMIELIESGFNNVICVQPFGCLPNHIVGKGMMKRIHTEFADSNIVAIDYDPGASKVNQENRIRLMLAIAKEKENK